MYGNSIPGQDTVDLNSLKNLVGNGAKNINIETSDGQKVSIKSVGMPTGQARRGQDGVMNSRGTGDLLGQNSTPLGEQLRSLAQNLGLLGGGSGSGKGAGMLNQIAALVANNSGRGDMGIDRLGAGAQQPPVEELLKAAASANGGAPTTPSLANAPMIPPGAGTNQNSVGLLGGGGGGGGPSNMAGLLGPLMSAAGSGAPQPSPGAPQGGGGLPPELMAALAGGGGAPQGGQSIPNLPPELAALLGVPGRAFGGPVAGGKPYVVGEKGPEVIVPRQNGQVVPNQSLLGQNQQQNYQQRMPLNQQQNYGQNVQNLAQQMLKGMPSGTPQNFGQSLQNLAQRSTPNNMVRGIPTNFPDQLASLLGLRRRAEGGPVEAGEAYLVGEAGPEAVIPEQNGGSGNLDMEGAQTQIDSIVDEVIAEIEARGISLLGADGSMSPEALKVFIEVLQSKVPTEEENLDSIAQQIGGGQTPAPGSDPMMSGVMSGAGGSNNAPILDSLGGTGAPAPDMTGATPSGPDDIQALLAALGG